MYKIIAFFLFIFPPFSVGVILKIFDNCWGTGKESQVFVVESCCKDGWFFAHPTRGDLRQSQIRRSIKCFYKLHFSVCHCRVFSCLRFCILLVLLRQLLILISTCFAVSFFSHLNFSFRLLNTYTHSHTHIHMHIFNKCHLHAIHTISFQKNE